MAKVFSGIPMSPESRATGDDGRLVDRSLVGLPRTRLFYTNPVYEIVVVWSSITQTQRNTIESQYDTNKALEVEFDLVESTGNVVAFTDCEFVTIPNFVSSAKTGSRFNGTCTLLGLKGS